MLIDEVTINIKAGNGGSGSASLRRTAQTSKGGPDGGNGGIGGNVYAIGVSDITALSQFQFKKEISAENAVSGGRNNLYGRNGVHTIIKVPLGTQIIDIKTLDFIEITDMTTQVLLATGGKGGLGNNALKTALNQTPTVVEQGATGELKRMRFILRLIADIGLVGLPNAGKSSLLSVLTNANPKIANYPFTTLEPNLGVFNKLVIADIPGLIEGASKGKGLGIKFLKHIEKTKIILHCIDASIEDPISAYHTVRQELLRYNSSISEKKEMILLTKIDLATKEKIERLKNNLAIFTDTVLTVSIYEESSLKKLKEHISKTLQEN